MSWGYLYRTPNNPVLIARRHYRSPYTLVARDIVEKGRKDYIQQATIKCLLTDLVSECKSIIILYFDIITSFSS